MYTILFVDDNKNIRELCQRELELEGYCVFSASNGKDALTLLTEILPDVVILDLQMPRMNGQETITRIHEMNGNIPVIFYTAYRDNLHFDFSSWRAEAWVEKSENLAELKLEIERVLEHHKRVAVLN